MKQHQMKAINRTFPSRLKAVKGLQDQSETIEILVDTAWGFACT